MLSWNLFHGRDHAPDESLHTWRSRLLGHAERGATHVQVNRDLKAEFTRILAAADWDIALLQECPPRWAEELGRDCDAEPHLALTSRNLPAPLNHIQWLVADALPDLIASWEGGANLTLVRAGAAAGAGSAISERHELTLTRRPERRVMAFARLRSGLCVANLHASQAAGDAARDTGRAAAAASRWARDAPLIFGGDLNLRFASTPAPFRLLEERHGLSASEPAAGLDHVLARGLDWLGGPRTWPAQARETPDPDTGLAIRLSDHAPVEARLRLPSGVGPGPANT